MITQSYIDFFEGLATNNTKEWFHAHKDEYEQQVKEPFLGLLASLLPQLQVWEPLIPDDPKSALFRINRDLRFSKDKTPYLTVMKAGFSPGGKKSELPGFYLGIDAESIHVGGGLFGLKGPVLKQVRTSIAAEPQAFRQMLDASAFKERFGELKGETTSRLPAEIQAAAQTVPELAHKQFYAMAKLPLAQHLNDEQLPQVILSYFEAIQPLNAFLKKAFV